MGLKLKNWEKFSILSWKNLYVSIKNYRVVFCITFIPAVFCIVLVILRLLTEVRFEPTRVYRPLDTNRSWSYLLSEIEARRMKIKETRPGFKHSAHVPQPILAYSPSSYTIFHLMQMVVKDDIRGVGIRDFENCEELKAAMKIEHFFAGVCFSYDLKVFVRLEIKIVFPSELRIYNDSFIGGNWNTNDLYDLYNSYEKRQMSRHDGGYVGYIREGFAAIQNAVAMAYIRWATEINFPTPKIQRYPTHARYYDQLTESTEILISFVLVCGFMCPVLSLTHNIVKEKKRNVKQMLKVMGVENWIQISAWFAKYFILMLISSFFIIILLKVKWNGQRGILPDVSISLLLLCFFAYITAAISFCIMVSAFFSDPKVAVPLTGIIWISSYLPFLAFTLRKSSPYFQTLMCCFCNTIFAFLVEVIVDFENFGTGLHWSSMTKNVSIHERKSAAFYILTLFLLSIVYILIAFYAEDLSTSFTFFSKKRTSVSSKKESTSLSSRRDNVRQTEVYEIEHSYKSVVIRIKNLNKAFKGVYAVKNLNMNVYKGDITVILGHNGSGKSILLQMIAGILAPTSGIIEIQGLDADKKKYFARRNLGISLNSDLPFPELDVIDQLIFFARIRGLVTPELENEVQKYLDVMHLNHRKYCAAHKLSKGEQQFLSVCCALIGGRKIILLDEPSLRLDISAKESLWELLRSESKRRSIILTTHCEEETEALADQIGVFSCGELKCFGSAFFLKKVYGQGHRLICYKGPEFQKDKLLNLIRRHIPLATIESEIGNQVSFILGDVKSFVNLFDDLENNDEEVGVSGISVAEMNSADIFFKVGAENPSDGNRQQHDGLNDNPSFIIDNRDQRLDGGVEKVTGFRLFMNQCQVMLSKRMVNSLRTIPLSLLQLTMPILFTVISFSLLSYNRQRDALGDMSFALQQYPESATFYHIDPTAASTNWSLVYDEYETELFWAGTIHAAEKVPTNIPGFNRYVLNEQKDLNEFEKGKYLVGLNIKEGSITAFFNNYPLHTVPLTLNMAHNAIVRALHKRASINTVFSPLPFSSSYDLNVKNLPVSIGNYLAVNISFCMSFIWSLSVIFLVRERKWDFKFFQHLFGVRGYVFWLNALAFDVSIIFITSLIILLTIVFFELDIFMEEEASGSYFLVLIAAGISMCSINYLASLLWRDPTAAYIAITTFNAMGTMSFWAYIEVFSSGFEDRGYSEFFVSLMRVFPYFSFCNTLVKSYNLAERKMICKAEHIEIHFSGLNECEIYPKCCRTLDVWDSELGIFPDLIYVVGSGLVCWILVCIIESYDVWTKQIGYEKLNTKTEYNFPEPDPDLPKTKMNLRMREMTVKDMQNVVEIDPDTNREKVLVSNRVCAEVGPHFLLKQITFAVNHGECFTILGKNASGKSALLHALIGRIPLSFGKVHIDGLNLNTNLKSIYQHIGYCSQNEVFLHEFKLFELMRMACLLRGIPNRKIMGVIEYLASILGFDKSLHKRYENCSRGIRKRIYCACAFIGNPQIIFFDCASSNLDLVGRRQLWKVVSRQRAKGQSFVLTTSGTKHYQKITDRLLVLSNGRHMMLNDPWSVCEKGYILKVKVRKITVLLPSSNESLTPQYQSVSTNTFLKLANFIENEFPYFEIKGQLGNTIEYFIPSGTTSISHIYRLMQRNSYNLFVEDFAISSLTLSTIFMEILKQEKKNQ